MGTYSIRELEQLSGIKAHTIRIWEQRYKLLEPHRTDTNIRYYDDEQLKFLLNVSLLSKNGYRISQICRWERGEFLKRVESLYDQSLLAQSEILLDMDANEVLSAMIEMDAHKFTRIYENAIKSVGFEETIRQLIYPFLEKVGLLWAIGQINPAQEHFISCLIRQKIIAAIDRLPDPHEGKKFLLLLPPAEHHEMGLLIAHYLIKKNGHRVYNLGQDLPMANISSAVECVQPHFVLTFLVDPSLVNKASDLIQHLKDAIAPAKLLVAMRKVEPLKAPKGVTFLHSMEDLDAYL